MWFKNPDELFTVPDISSVNHYASYEEEVPLKRLKKAYNAIWNAHPLAHIGYFMLGIH